MEQTLIKKPKFASEAEEAAWYPANPDYVRQQLERAEAEGRAGHGTADKRLGLTTPVTIRLSQEDIEKARIQAEKKGIGYQTYMKILLHEALAKAE
jgi:predicted DNA binding CopG/RHH family protein